SLHSLAPSTDWKLPPAATTGTTRYCIRSPTLMLWSNHVQLRIGDRREEIPSSRNRPRAFLRWDPIVDWGLGARFEVALPQGEPNPWPGMPLSYVDCPCERGSYYPRRSLSRPPDGIAPGSRR